MGRHRKGRGQSQRATHDWKSIRVVNELSDQELTDAVVQFLWRLQQGGAGGNNGETEDSDSNSMNSGNQGG